MPSEKGKHFILNCGYFVTSISIKLCTQRETMTKKRGLETLLTKLQEKKNNEKALENHLTI